MKASELRVGNLIHPCSTKNGITIPDRDLVWKVGSIDKFGKIGFIEPERPTIFLPIHECSPVMLAEEWLLKFGFEITTKGIDGFEMWFYSKNDVDIYVTSDGCFENELDLPIKYVHQLQNLYYALTGEELI
jgi:hypothetical protein